METIEYKRLFERESFYWWNIGRRDILKSVLNRHLVSQRGLSILDVGCGAGGNIKILGEFGGVTGFDISEEALKFARTHGTFKNLVSGNAEYLPFADESFDLVSALDVLEHIPDDHRAIREMFRVLKKGGFALITVPTHRWLWSRHDQALHHLRRYTTNELRTKLASAGFRVVQHSHFVIPAILFLLLKKMIRRIKKMWGAEETVDTYDTILPPWLNRVLTRWLYTEKMMMRYISIPAGSSFMMLARKLE